MSSPPRRLGPVPQPPTRSLRERAPRPASTSYGGAESVLGPQSWALAPTVPGLSGWPVAQSGGHRPVALPREGRTGRRQSRGHMRLPAPASSWAWQHPPASTVTGRSYLSRTLPSADSPFTRAVGHGLRLSIARAVISIDSSAGDDRRRPGVGARCCRAGQLSAPARVPGYRDRCHSSLYRLFAGFLSQATISGTISGSDSDRPRAASPSWRPAPATRARIPGTGTFTTAPAAAGWAGGCRPGARGPSAPRA